MSPINSGAAVCLQAPVCELGRLFLAPYYRRHSLSWDHRLSVRSTHMAFRNKGKVSSWKGQPVSARTPGHMHTNADITWRAAAPTPSAGHKRWKRWCFKYFHYEEKWKRGAVDDFERTASAFKCRSEKSWCFLSLLLTTSRGEAHLISSLLIFKYLNTISSNIKLLKCPLNLRKAPASVRLVTSLAG